MSYHLRRSHPDPELQPPYNYRTLCGRQIIGPLSDRISRYGSTPGMCAKCLEKRTAAIAQLASSPLDRRD
jgi:hypothetical protein